MSEVQIIPAENPTAEEMATICSNIKAKYPNDVHVEPVLFRFKTQVDKDTGVSTKREPLELPIPYPTIQGIIAILEKQDPKEIDLLKDAVDSIITAAARDLINDDVEINANNFPAEKLTWNAIANIPKASRKGGGIPKETWEEFTADYIEVMQEATGKSIEQVTRAAKILQGKFAQVKTNKPVIKLLVGQLGVYAENSPNIGDYSDCVEFLANKAETLLQASDDALLEAL